MPKIPPTATTLAFGLLSICTFFLLSCSNRPIPLTEEKAIRSIEQPKGPKLGASAKLSKSVISKGENLIVTVDAWNPHQQTILTAPYIDWNRSGGTGVMDNVSIFFSKSKNGEFDPTAAITSDSVSVSPPLFDPVKPGESRTYRFSWVAEGSLPKGNGYLHILFPPEFSQIKPMPLRVQ